MDDRVMVVVRDREVVGWRDRKVLERQVDFDRQWAERWKRCAREGKGFIVVSRRPARQRKQST